MKPSPFRPHRPNWLRNMVDLAILFLIAVIMLRGFILEGYLISTGSMAPGLLGFHKQITCPSCTEQFAFGVSFDESVDSDAASVSPARDYATCPNCGQINIAVAAVPPNHGDQLLVHKGVFDFRRPRRWETVVFRNPADPGEAYVKRVVGLPGESLQILDGDLYIDGVIARKEFDAVRDMRIRVFDIRHRPQNAEWQLPWRLEGGWGITNDHLTCSDSSATATHWLKYRNWRWAGGTHVVEVPLRGKEAFNDWNQCLLKLKDRPISWVTRLECDRTRGLLRFHGVMPYQMQQELIAWADTEEFRKAIYRLGALSHASPIMDSYGYNSAVSSPEFPVRDLMLETQIQWDVAPEAISVHIPVETRVAQLELDFRANRASLIVDESNEPAREADLPILLAAAQSKGSLQLAVSNFDHRLIVALDGEPIFDSVDLPVETSGIDIETERDPAIRAEYIAKVVTQQSRLAIGVRGGSVSVPELTLYRDVFYTPGRRRNGIQSPLQIPQSSYFVQGDNSPVSSDSRNWAEPCVPHRLLVGKPFVVHLPSRPGKLTVGGIELPIRIPDLRRIRYIR